MKCKVCDNEITLDRGIRGSHGTDINGDPIPFWTVDPLKTPLGLAGQNYVGRDPMRRVYLKELQDYYNSIEEDMGLIKTDFLDITKLNEPFRRAHIEQLRIAIEKILNEKGMTLQDYFCSDRLGNVIPGKIQSEWTDVDRSIDGLPRLPKNKPIRAIYIEELRRGISIFGILCVTPVDKPDKQSGTGYFYYDVSGDKAVKNFNIPTGLDWLTLNNYQNFYFENPKFLYLLYSNGSLWFNRMNTNTKIWSSWFDFQFEDTDINSNDCSHLTGHILSEKVGSEEYDINYHLYTSELFYKRIGITLPGKNLYNLLYKLPYYIAKYYNIKSRLLGISNGNSSQTFSIGSKLDWNLISAYVGVDDLFILVSGKKWTRVSNFSGSSSTDEHFTIDINGVVTFGDGVNGKIPASNSKISVLLSVYLSNYLKWKFEKTYPDDLDIRDKEKAYTFIRDRKDESDKKLYSVKLKHPMYIQFNHLTNVASVLSNYGWMDNWVGGSHYCRYKSNTIATIIGQFQNNVYYGDNSKIKYNVAYNIKDRSCRDNFGCVHFPWDSGQVAIPDLVNDTQIISMTNNSFQFKTPVAKIMDTGDATWVWQNRRYDKNKWELYNIDPRQNNNLPISFISRYVYEWYGDFPFLKTKRRVWSYITKSPHFLNHNFDLDYKIWLTYINGNPILTGDFELLNGNSTNWAGGYSLYCTDSYWTYGTAPENMWMLLYTRYLTGGQGEPDLIPVIFTFKVQLCNNDDVNWFQKVYGFSPIKEYNMILQAS